MKNANKGFSFVELLVAIAILGIISLPIASSFALSAKIDAKARETYSAANAAEDVLLIVTEIQSVYSISEPTEISGERYPDINTAHYIHKWLTENVPDKNNLTAETSEPAKYEYVYTFDYSGYGVKLLLTECGSFYRVDVTVTYTVAGDTMQVTRKGVLPHA